MSGNGKQVTLEDFPIVKGMITHVERISMPDGSTKNIQYTMPAHVEYVWPAGFLPAEIAAVALFHYAVIARAAYEDTVKSPIVLEGDPDPSANFKQTFSSIARAYGVRPEVMVKFWAQVDMQFGALEIPLLPKEEKYRFSKTPEIVTNVDIRTAE